MVLIAFVVFYGVAKKKGWLFSNPYSRPALQHDPESLPHEPRLAECEHQRQGTCGNSQHAEGDGVIRRIPETGTLKE